MIYSQDKALAIRSIEKTDLVLIQSWRNNEDIRRYFREYREFSIEQLESWYNNMIKDRNFEMFVIINCESNKVIGVTGLTYIDWVNRHADVHFYIGINGEWIDDKYSKIAIKIILDYGFNILNLNKIWSEIYEIDNKKLGFFSDIGFSVDAKLRDHYFYQGKYHMSYILSLLRKEYE